MEGKIEIFICYAHKDESLMRELEAQLGTLVQQGFIKIWHDRKIIGGAEWKQEINKHLNSAHIILLLVSANFIGSEYSHIEVKRAMERYDAGEAHVIPVILRPVSWRGSSFGQLKPFPKDGRPVTSSLWHNQDEAFFDIVEGIEKVVEELRAKSGKSAPTSSSPNPRNSSPHKETLVPQQPTAQGNNEFDVFLCHNSKDKPEVKEIAEQLKARGIVPWLDVWELRPGLPWQRALEEQIEHIKSAAVFVGKNGRGPWQDMELEAFLREFVDRKCPVIPVVLSDAPDKPQLPPFLRGMTWVDFRKQDPNPMEQLIWGITGANPNAGGSSGQNTGVQAPVSRPQKPPPIEPVLARPDSIFPFIVRLPKTSEFFGRVIDRVTLIDRTYIQASTSIVGSRRIGKTWLLQYLMLVARTELGSRFRICYLDATTPSCATVAGFIAEVLKGFGYSNLIAHSDSDLKLLERYVKELRKRNQPPILCIDEFEGLDNEQEFDLNFFRSLRSIAEAGLVLVVASKRPLIEIVGEPGKTSGFFNIFEQLTIEPFNLEEAEAFAKAKGNQAGFTDQERDLLLKYGQTEEQRWSPLRLQLVGKMLLGDKLLGEKEGIRYYSPNDPSYWQKFERRLEDKYRGVVY